MTTPKPLSIQLYTLRDAAKQDFPAVLRTLAEIGYQGAKFVGQNPAEVVAAHKARLPLLHIKDGTLEKDAPHVAAGSGNWTCLLSSAPPTRACCSG